MNTLTRTKTLFVTALLPLLAAPLISHADSDLAMDACVQAFVNTSLEKARPFTIRKEEFVDSQVAQYSRAYRISLTAVGKHSGKQVAKATCVVDRKGVVLSMNGKPVAAPAALAQTPVLSRR